MKNRSKIINMLCIIVCAYMAFACSQKNVTVPVGNHIFSSPLEVKSFLIEGNRVYMASNKNNADISLERRLDLAQNGQEPYALILTCSDSRVAPEHIFNAGLGDVFVVRNAGNVISDFELGSIEYAIEHLGVQYILILGHEKCGAVDSALHSHEPTTHDISLAQSSLDTILCEVSSAIGDTTDAREAEILNLENSLKKVHANPIVKKFLEEKKILVEGGVYHVENGEVVFME